jgi:hypothetical protein
VPLKDRRGASATPISGSTMLFHSGGKAYFFQGENKKEALDRKPILVNIETRFESMPALPAGGTRSLFHEF